MKQPREGLHTVSTYPLLTDIVGQNRFRIVLHVVMMFSTNTLGTNYFTLNAVKHLLAIGHLLLVYIYISLAILKQD